MTVAGSGNAGSPIDRRCWFCRCSIPGICEYVNWETILLGGNCLCTSSLLIRREVLEKIGPLDEGTAWKISGKSSSVLTGECLFIFAILPKFCLDRNCAPVRQRKMAKKLFWEPFLC